MVIVYRKGFLAEQKEIAFDDPPRRGAAEHRHAVRDINLQDNHDRGGSASLPSPESRAARPGDQQAQAQNDR
jgi:hypothetical protein